MTRAAPEYLLLHSKVVLVHTLPVSLEMERHVLERLRDPGRVSSDGIGGIIPSLAPAGIETEVFETFCFHASDMHLPYRRDTHSIIRHKPPI